MSTTFTRVIPSSQMAITRRELQDAGATGIRFVSVGDGYVEVTAQMPKDDRRGDKPRSFTRGFF